MQENKKITKNQVELLAPAGDEDCFKAAIAAGADAVYFGMEQFSARSRAKNITVEQAKYLIPLAHEHNCRAYLTLNTLIKDTEMADAVSLVEKAVECGIDAVIIQDIGVLKVIRSCFPELEIHASTQMTTHNLSQCSFLSELGVSQINLSRELALPEIKKITEYLHSKNIIPEIFVQGAFCISYSGQCYLSGYLYNQAGNRGDCVQPCRREWCVKSCGNSDSQITSGYKALFHLKDNSAFPLADKLIQENVPVSLKIEGRIKNAEYVWAVTSAWREQIDLVLLGKQIQKASNKLNGAINRDYTCGYLEGNISSQMFSSGTKDISQIKTGIVKNYIADSKTLIFHDNTSLTKGDRLTIKTQTDQFICTATVLEKTGQGYKIQITNKLTKKILNGQIVYKSTSVISEDELSKIINTIGSKSKSSQNCHDCEKKYKTEISVRAVLNEPLQITYKTGNYSVTVESEKPLEKAQTAGLTAETLQEKLSKLGGTQFTADSFKVLVLDSGLFLSLGEINNLRRRAIELLTEKISQNTNGLPEKLNKTPVPELPETLLNPVLPIDAYLIDVQKDLEQLILERSINKKPYKIIFELPSAISQISKELFDLLNVNKDVVLYFNSILLDSDLDSAIGFLKSLDNLSGREILCENTGLAYELRDSGCKIILGPNCNIYNSWNIKTYAENLNLWALIPSLELNSNEIEKLKFPENIQIWYPEKMHSLLMQSRQCLLKNGSGCTKNNTNRTCIESCGKKLLLNGVHQEEILAIKRPGFYSSLYSAENVKTYCKSDFFKNYVSVWIIDKRF